MVQSNPSLNCSCFYKTTSPAEFASHRALVPGCAGFFTIMGVSQSVESDTPHEGDGPKFEAFKCGCGDIFTDVEMYKRHRARNRAPCRELAPFVDLDNRCNHFLSSSHISPMSKITAYFGDLAHKRHVVEHFQAINSDVVSYFSNSHQAWYVLTEHPDLVPPPESGNAPGIHTLGTIFEYHFETQVSFRFSYLKWLPLLLTPAPVIPPGFRLDTRSTASFWQQLFEFGGECA